MFFVLLRFNYCLKETIMQKVLVKIRCYTRDICFEVIKNTKTLQHENLWLSELYMALGLMK